MDHALRMDDYLNLLRTRSEQPARLDDLQSLVHHGRRIHRYLASHDPVRMRTGLVRRHAVQLRTRTPPEGSARSGEKDPADPFCDGLAGREGRKALENCVVLAVYGQQHRPAGPHRLHEHGARDHQRFLVCEEKLLACSRSGERGAKPRRSNDGGHDAVDSGQRSHFDESGLPREYPATQTGSGEALVQPRRERGIRHAGVVGAVELAQLCQLIDLPIGGQCRHAKARRMPRDHIQSARSDRARRSEYRDVLNGGHFMNTSTASGSMAMGASMRSSIPPWPGRNVPLSFTPAWRFIRDSNRSPIIPTTASPSRTGTIHAAAVLAPPGQPPERLR